MNNWPRDAFQDGGVKFCNAAMVPTCTRAHPTGQHNTASTALIKFWDEPRDAGMLREAMNTGMSGPLMRMISFCRMSITCMINTVMPANNPVAPMKITRMM